MLGFGCKIGGRGERGERGGVIIGPIRSYRPDNCEQWRTNWCVCVDFVFEFCVLFEVYVLYDYVFFYYV